MTERAAPATALVRLNLPGLRRNRGLSLEQIAADSKISKQYLEAIEAGRFDLLPGKIYSVSYIRQYAKAIDLDENLILAAYRETVAVDEPAPAAASIPRLGVGDAIRLLASRFGIC